MASEDEDLIMQSIDPNTVYELTPEGRDVMQHRSLQLPTELRFLMMLISGTRSVGTLRVVSPAAKHDDAGFIILMEYGLIKNSADEPVMHSNEAFVNQSENQALFRHESTAEHTLNEVVWPPTRLDENKLTVAEADHYFIEPSFSPTERVQSYAENLAAAATTVNPSSTDAQDQVQITESSLFSDGQAPTEAEMSNSAYEAAERAPVDELCNSVSNEDRHAVELILLRALKQDAKFVIDQLAQKNTYADFLPAVKKLEQALRETVSTIEANALRDRFSAAF
jgi:hypothetical protein